MKYNRVQLVGHLVEKPNKKEIEWIDKGGQKSTGVVTEFSLAVDSYKKQKTNFFNIQLFNGKALRAFQYLKKGSLVLVEGSIDLERVDRLKDGVEFTTTFCHVNATEFRLLEKKAQMDVA